MLHEGKLDDALALVQSPNRCQGELLWKLAKQLPSGQHAQAVALMMRVFDVVMPGARNPYARELQLAHDILQRQDARQAAAWLEQIRIAYKAKRNFIKGLPAAAGKPD